MAENKSLKMLDAFIGVVPVDNEEEKPIPVIKSKKTKEPVDKSDSAEKKEPKASIQSKSEPKKEEIKIIKEETVKAPVEEKPVEKKKEEVVNETKEVVVKKEKKKDIQEQDKEKNIKSISISVYFSEEEAKSVYMAAKFREMKVATYIRSFVIEDLAKNKETYEEGIRIEEQLGAQLKALKSKKLE